MGFHACGEESIPAEPFAAKAVIVRTAGGEPDSIVALSKASRNTIRSFVEVSRKIVITCHRSPRSPSGSHALHVLQAISSSAPASW